MTTLRQAAQELVDKLKASQPVSWAFYNEYATLESALKAGEQWRCSICSDSGLVDGLSPDGRKQIKVKCSCRIKAKEKPSFDWSPFEPPFSYSDVFYWIEDANGKIIVEFGNNNLVTDEFAQHICDLMNAHAERK